MDDQSNEDVHKGQPEYDGTDAEVPFLEHEVGSGSQHPHAHEEKHPANRYVKPALGFLKGASVWFWVKVIANAQFWMASATVVMAVSTAVYTRYAWRQWKAVSDEIPEIRKSADAAQKTLGELQKSGSDTHDLAEAAKAQAVELAESLKKSDQLIREAAAQAKAAQASVTLATQESAESGERTEKQLKTLQDQVAASHDQATAALQSAAAIQRQTIISERPWLSVEATTEGLTYSGQQGNQPALVLNLSIRNVGKSVAKNVQADAKMFAAAPGMPISVDAPQKQHELCDHPKLSQAFATDLFPSDIPVQRQLDISVLPADVATQSITSLDGSRSFVSFYVVGCVTYLFSFDNEIGQTRFAYHLMGPVGPFTKSGQVLQLSGGKMPMADFETGANVPKNELGLAQEGFAYNDAR